VVPYGLTTYSLSQSSWAHPGGLHSRRLKTRFAAVPSRFAC